MKTLTHNQQIRVSGFRNYCKITVGTLTGYALEHGETPEQAISCANKFGHSLAPWTTQAPAVLMDNFRGKDAMLNKERAERVSATEITDGEMVNIEGSEFKVRVLGEGYSDPVHFIAEKATA